MYRDTIRAIHNSFLRAKGRQRLLSRKTVQSRTDVLNVIAYQAEARRYLEIGVRDRLSNFDRVLVPIKHGVDPAPARGRVDYCMTSDEFFATLDADRNP